MPDGPSTSDSSNSIAIPPKPEGWSNSTAWETAYAATLGIIRQKTESLASIDDHELITALEEKKINVNQSGANLLLTAAQGQKLVGEVLEYQNIFGHFKKYPVTAARLDTDDLYKETVKGVANWVDNGSPNEEVDIFRLRSVTNGHVTEEMSGNFLARLERDGHIRKEDETFRPVLPDTSNITISPELQKAALNCVRSMRFRENQGVNASVLAQLVDCSESGNGKTIDRPTVYAVSEWLQKEGAIGKEPNISIYGFSYFPISGDYFDNRLSQVPGKAPTGWNEEKIPWSKAYEAAERAVLGEHDPMGGPQSVSEWPIESALRDLVKKDGVADPNLKSETKMVIRSLQQQGVLGSPYKPNGFLASAEYPIMATAIEEPEARYRLLRSRIEARSEPQNPEKMKPAAIVDELQGHCTLEEAKTFKERLKKDKIFSSARERANNTGPADASTGGDGEPRRRFTDLWPFGKKKPAHAAPDLGGPTGTLPVPPLSSTAAGTTPSLNENVIADARQVLKELYESSRSRDENDPLNAETFKREMAQPNELGHSHKITTEQSEALLKTLQQKGLLTPIAGADGDYYIKDPASWTPEVQQRKNPLQSILSWRPFGSHDDKNKATKSGKASASGAEPDPAVVGLVKDTIKKSRQNGIDNVSASTLAREINRDLSEPEVTATEVAGVLKKLSDDKEIGPPGKVKRIGFGSGEENRVYSLDPAKWSNASIPDPNIATSAEAGGAVRTDAPVPVPDSNPAPSSGATLIPVPAGAAAPTPKKNWWNKVLDVVYPPVKNKQSNKGSQIRAGATAGAAGGSQGQRVTLLPETVDAIPALSKALERDGHDRIGVQYVKDNAGVDDEKAKRIFKNLQDKGIIDQQPDPNDAGYKDLHRVNRPDLKNLADQIENPGQAHAASRQTVTPESLAQTQARETSAPVDPRTNIHPVPSRQENSPRTAQGTVSPVEERRENTAENRSGNSGERGDSLADRMQQNFNAEEINRKKKKQAAESNLLHASRLSWLLQVYQLDRSHILKHDSNHLHLDIPNGGEVRIHGNGTREVVGKGGDDVYHALIIDMGKEYGAKGVKVSGDVDHQIMVKAHGIVAGVHVETSKDLTHGRNKKRLDAKIRELQAARTPHISNYADPPAMPDRAQGTVDPGNHDGRANPGFEDISRPLTTRRRQAPTVADPAPGSGAAA